MDIPSWMLGPTPVCSCPQQSCCTPSQSGPGVPNTDYVLFVTASSTSSCFLEVAYSIECQRDVFDRPTIGRLNICPSQLRVTTPQEQVIQPILHHMLHILGFSDTSWWRFRDIDTLEPQTPRAGPGPYAVAKEQELLFCLGIPFSHSVVSNRTLQYFDERGMQECKTIEQQVNISDCVQKMVGPHTAAATQWYFGCPTIQGAELENQYTSPCAISGSHLEQRIFSGSIMTAVADYRSAIDPVTLGILHDSGWYLPNYSAGDPFYPRDFGFKQGCAFAQDKCLAGSKSNPQPQGSPPRWVTASGSDLCSFDLKAVGYPFVPTFSENLRSQYQYFTNPSMGGLTSYRDHCPLLTLYNNRHCTDTNSDSPNSFDGTDYGPGGVCLVSSVRSGSMPAPVPLPGCYLSDCLPQAGGGFHLRVRFYESAGQYGTALCTSAGQMASFGAGYAGSVECPDPDYVCAPGEVFTPDGASPSASVTPSRNPSASGSASPSASGSGSSTASPSGSATGSGSPSASGSGSSRATASGAATSTA